MYICNTYETICLKNINEKGSINAGNSRGACKPLAFSNGSTVSVNKCDIEQIKNTWINS